MDGRIKAIWVTYFKGVFLNLHLMERRQKRESRHRCLKIKAHTQISHVTGEEGGEKKGICYFSSKIMGRVLEPVAQLGDAGGGRVSHSSQGLIRAFDVFFGVLAQGQCSKGPVSWRTCQLWRGEERSAHKHESIS